MSDSSDSFNSLYSFSTTTNTAPSQSLTVEDLERVVQQLRDDWPAHRYEEDVLFQRLACDPIRFKSDEEYRRRAPTEREWDVATNEGYSFCPDLKEFKRRYCPDSTFLDE